MLRKIISLTLTLSFLLQQTVFAYTASLNLSNYLNSGANLTALDRFRPISLRYFSYLPLTNDFKILFDKGDYAKSSGHQDTMSPEKEDSVLKETAKELMDYFKIGLSLPNEKFWVNLRPDSEDEIIDEELAKTDLGKVMLEADLKLKQDTSLFTSPQTPQGKEYWNKLYKKAGELFGTENITIPTLTRPWIVPGEIILRESNDKSSQGAYIYKANLKVMLEDDYLTSRGERPFAPTYKQYEFNDPRLKELNQYSTQLIRELILPRLTQKVNSSKDYANLRQVYFSLILARWFKETFSPQSTIHISRADPYIKLIDSKDLTNLTSKTPWNKTTYFNAYQKSFQEGEYNLSEPIYTPTGQVIRRYMSGGLNIMSGSPLELRGRFLGKIKNLPSILKNLVGIDVKNPDYLSEDDKHILKAGLMNLFDASIVIEKIEGAIDDIYESYPDFAWLLPDKVKKFIKEIAKSQDKKEFLKNKTISALENRLSKEETECLLTIWSTYYKYIANEIDSRLQSTNSYEEDFSTIRRILESAKFKDTKLGKEFASAWHKSDFIKNIINLNVNNEKRKMEEVSILSHAWREISGATSDSGYITSEEAEKIADKYKDEMLKYEILINDILARNPHYFDYFGEEAVSQIKGLLKINKIKEGADRALREIYGLYNTYAFRYEAWALTYRRHVERYAIIRPIRFVDYSRELDGLSDEIKTTLSNHPLFPKNDKFLREKKEQDPWEAAEENLRRVEIGLDGLKNTKSILELFKELPGISEYLYARAVTVKEKTQLDKLKKEINNFISANIRWLYTKQFKEYLDKGEARDVILTMVNIALIYAEKTGVDSKEFHKWQGKAQALAKQFQAPSVSSSLAIEQYKELIEQVFKNYESGGGKLPEYLQAARDEIRKSFGHSSLHKLLTDAAELIRKDEPEFKSLRDIYLTLINSAEAIKNEIFDSPYYHPNTSALLIPKDTGSSALETTAPIKTGGIDFREMSILTKPMGSFSGLNFNLPILSKAELESLDLDAGLADIQKMVKSGIVPSGNRLKEYLWACHQKGELDSRRDDIIISLAEICGLEESLAKESDPDLREALVLAEWI